MFSSRVAKTCSRLVPPGRFCLGRLGGRYSSTSDQVTPLYNEHIKRGATMASFADWTLPMLFNESHIVSHHHTRKNASVFDVCHMQQIVIKGDSRHDFMDRICVADTRELKENQMTYSLLTNENGGIIDDCMITNFKDYIYLVVNAGCATKDLKHLNKQVQDFAGTKLHATSDRGLIALQGPEAKNVLQRGVHDLNLDEVGFLSAREVDVHGYPCIVNRCGYTGEDGFEISVAEKNTADLWNKFLEEPHVLPAGLAVRDSLRLEAGLCLYGHDINESTTPLEASLTWTIGKRRKEEGGFLGAEKILGQMKTKDHQRRRVGVILDKGIAREGTSFVVDPSSGQVAGEFTSGTFSPILKKGIGMAYVDVPHTKIGTKVQVRVKDRMYDGTISKMPFTPHHYYKKD